MSESAPPDLPKLTAADYANVETKLVVIALQKLDSGQTPTRQEMEALKRAKDRGTARPSESAPAAAAPAPAAVSHYGDVKAIATRYKINRKTVTRLNDRGKKNSVPVPWHDPVELQVWYAAHYSSDLPGWLIAALKSRGRAPVPHPDPPPAQQQPPPPPPAPETSDDDEPASFADTLARFDAVVRAREEDLTKAQLIEDPVQRAAVLKNATDAYTRAVQVRNGLEANRIPFLEAEGRVVDRTTATQRFEENLRALWARLRLDLKASRQAALAAAASDETWPAFIEDLLHEIARRSIDVKFSDTDPDPSFKLTAA